ncbi:MAG: hypothetical protein ACLQL2_06155 [Methylovirgula sp.]
MHPSKPLPPTSSAKLSQWRTAETQTILDQLSDSLRQALADHQAMLGVLLQRHVELPLEIGELFEDAGNAYVEMSERVSQKFLIARNHTPG